MGSMVAVMAIITVLLVFLAVFPTAFEDPEEKEVPLYFLDDLSVTDGKMVFGIDMEGFLVKEDIRGMRLIVMPIGLDGTYSEMFGSSGHDKVNVMTGTFVLKVEDRTLNAQYEAAVWSWT